MEQSFAGFIQQCLHIVPSERPSMADFHEAMCDTQTMQYRSQYFPLSEHYIGDCPVLMNKNCIVVGHIGSGRRRILHENIRLAYLDGIPVFIAKAAPLKPFHLWRNIIESVLRQVALKTRTRLYKESNPKCNYYFLKCFPQSSR